MRWTRHLFTVRNAASAAAGIFVWLPIFAVTVFGITNAVAAEFSMEILTDKDAPGNDYERKKGISLKACEVRCLKDSKCAAFTYNQRRKICFLKDREDPELADFRGAVTGLKKVLQEAALPPSEPEPDTPAVTADDAASPQIEVPEEPAEPVKPEIRTARIAGGCTLFDSDFALTRDPNVILKFDQAQENAADDEKARMSFYDRGSKVLSGNLRLKADQFRFIEDSAASAGDGPGSRAVTILDRTNPSGDSIRDPIFVVIGGLPFEGGVFRRVACRTP